MKDAFKDYFIDLVGAEEAQAFFAAIEAKQTRRGIRVNTLKASVGSVADWLSSAGYKVRRSPFSHDGLEIEGRGEQWSLKLPYFTGFTYPQDPASMFAVELLDPQPGEAVIDLTAAPGGKSTHIAQRMENRGVLISNDHDKRRLKAVHSNLERLGMWNTVVTRMTPYKLAQQYPETFDRVLLDPSCSGEGLLVTYDGKPSHWSKKSLKRYATEQYGLLCSAFMLLKPGGRLVYSTCTLNSEEDEKVALKLLKKFPEAEILNVDVPGMPKQLAGLEGVRFWPHITQTKGFFCIAIGKKASISLPPAPEGERVFALKKKERAQYFNLFKKHWGELPEDVEIVKKHDHLFLVSKEITRFEFPRFHSLGFPFYKLNEQRFTHAGALWMGAQNLDKCVEVPAEHLETFFKEKAFPLEVEEGFHLLKSGDFALGIGKQEDGRMHPLIPVMH